MTYDQEKELLDIVELMQDQINSLHAMIAITNKRIDNIASAILVGRPKEEVGLKGLLEEALGKKDEKDL